MKQFIQAFEAIVIGPNGRMQATSDEFNFEDFDNTDIAGPAIEHTFVEFLNDISNDMNKLNMEEGMKVNARKEISQVLTNVLMDWASAQ